MKNSRIKKLHMDKVASGGIDFCGLLTIVFIALKLMNYISWSWWWVLSPLWIPPVAILAILLFIALVIVLLESADKKW